MSQCEFVFKIIKVALSHATGDSYSYPRIPCKNTNSSILLTRKSSSGSLIAEVFFNSLVAYESHSLGSWVSHEVRFKTSKHMSSWLVIVIFFYYICVLIYNSPQKETSRLPSIHFQGALNVSLRAQPEFL